MLGRVDTSEGRREKGGEVDREAKAEHRASTGGGGRRRGGDVLQRACGQRGSFIRTEDKEEGSGGWDCLIDFCEKGSEENVRPCAAVFACARFVLGASKREGARDIDGRSRERRRNEDVRLRHRTGQRGGSGARGDGEARTAQGKRGAKLGSSDCCAGGFGVNMNSSAEVVTLRNHAAAARMQNKARDAIEQLTNIMEATLRAGDAAGRAAAGVKEYMRVLGTVAGKNTAAITCLNKAATSGGNC
ncbi:hypothetical protein ERJ75_001771600 [Trypanosoma vivax]|nr:hypothetical protein ERJ75_001771600 [Trypanosoma vivax]